MKSILSIATITAVALLAAPAVHAHCGACGVGDAKHSHSPAQPSIVETAVKAGSFTTLVAAVKAAGLVDTLSNEGPYTVFAPTDDAFAKLPAGTVEALLADPDKLRSILLYHVVPGKVSSSQVVSLDRATTAQGSDVQISAGDGSVKINDAKVIQTDIETSNGIIHVIDTVILPS
jgi:uncharacterized surface protein with fasciclin (FAS1) repeats